MPESHQRTNRARSAVRSAAEHVFADQKVRMALLIRTIGLGRATVKIGHNFRRPIWLEGWTANPEFTPSKNAASPPARSVIGMNSRSRPVYRGVLL